MLYTLDLRGGNGQIFIKLSGELTLEDAPLLDGVLRTLDDGVIYVDVRNLFFRDGYVQSMYEAVESNEALDTVAPFLCAIVKICDPNFGLIYR